MPSDRNSTSVLIVGAGPTGLTLGAALSRYGIPFRILERKPALSVHSKATNVMQRNREVAAALGFAGELDATGGPMRRLMVHAYGRCFGPRTMHLADTAYPDVLLCGQNNYEAVVARHLGKSGISVDFRTELKGLNQTRDAVVATVESPAGTAQISADYLVGCDGAAGVSRRSTSLDFEPTKTGVAIRQVDCTLRWKRLDTMEQMWLFYFRNGFAAVVPLPGGIHRILLVEPKDRMPPREPSLDEVQAKLRGVAGDDSATLSDVRWSSYTDLSMGIGPGLRDGRVLLAGDAGNPILPNGGQGMNTGISDAYNLGWKLASVIAGSAPDALLDSYAHERYALRRSLQKVQYNSLKYTTLSTPWPMRALFRLLAEPLLNRGGEAAMARAFSELGIHTRRSPLTLERCGRRGLRAGDRVLPAEVVRDGRSVSIPEILYAGGWTLMAFTGIDPRRASEAVRAVEKFGRSDLPRFLVSTADVSVSSETVLYDLDEVAHRAYRVRRPTVYLVRPDGHVGARVGPRDISRLRAYADAWIPISEPEGRSPLHGRPAPTEENK